MDDSNNALPPPKARLVGAVTLIVMPISGAGIDIYTPSLPTIRTFFHCQSNHPVQLTVTCYIIAYGLFQLLFGSLSDIWGRKKILLFGTALFTIASLLAPLSPSIFMLMGCRILQGLAMGAIAAPCRALLPDTFSGKTYHKMVSYLTLAWGLGPIIAPVLGGYLQHYVNWRAPLWALAIYGIIAFALVTTLPETLPPEKRSVPNQIVGHYKIIFSSYFFLAYVALLMLLYSVITMFSVTGPFLIQVTLRQTAITYGHISLLIGTAWLLGTLTNRFLLDIPITKKVITSLIIGSLLVIIMLIFSHYYAMSVSRLTVMMCLLSFICGFVLPSGYALSLGLFPQASGSASAIMGSLFISGAGAATIIAAFFHTATLIPLLIAYLFIFINSLVLIILTLKSNVSSPS